LFYQDQLKQFDKISLRERSGQQIVLECANKNAEVVVDPTILFTPQQWRALANGKSKIPSEPYILTYCLSNNPEMRMFINKLNTQTGYKVIAISRGIKSMITEQACAIPTPLEFVNLFANAAYVVTNSFHGTAFSCNLNCNFYSFISGTKMAGTNSRIVDFLEMLNLQDRIMTTCPHNDIDLSLPDFSEANKVLNSKRKESVEFLKKAMLSN